MQPRERARVALQPADAGRLLLCEHHLGKGRMRSVTGGRGGAGQLGRTEPRKNTAAAAVAAAPKAAAAVAEPPVVRPC